MASSASARHARRAPAPVEVAAFVPLGGAPLFCFRTRVVAGNAMARKSRPTHCVTPLQERDTCLALTFLLLLLWVFFRWTPLVWAALGMLFLGMTVPAALRPAAWLWFGLARVLGAVTSRLVLTVVYAAVLLPVALVRRLLGKDDLRLALWKRGRGSCFLRREHMFGPEDFRHPY